MLPVIQVTFVFTILCPLVASKPVEAAPSLQERRNAHHSSPPFIIEHPDGANATSNSPGLNTTNRQLVCDERRRGVNLNLVSCANAVAQINRRSTESVSVGWPAQADVQAALPLRYISDNGKCFLSVFLKDGHSWDNTSSAELSAAAQLLFTGCVSLLNTGGAVDGLGTHGNLGIRIEAFDPTNVECFRPRGPSKDCVLDALERMPKFKIPQIFGPPSCPTAQVKLPQTVKDSHGRCAINILSTDVFRAAGDYSRWTDISLAAAVVNAVCVGKGMGGRINRFGSNRNLYVSVLKMPQQHLEIT